LINFQKDPKNVQKWKPFIRKDLDDVKLTNILGFMTYIPRFIALWPLAILCGPMAWILQITSKTPKLDDSRYWLFNVLVQPALRLMVYISGYAKIDKK
jgi:hypothetical protein